MIAKTISHYKILEKLGEGGMGVVYKAEDTKLKRTVALKFLPATALVREADKIRFMHEAQAAAALNHPNICTIYEIEETEDGQQFIAMEYVDGQSLKTMIDGNLPKVLNVREVVNIAIQVAEGLRAAHEKGIVHRDVKPANIMITDKGQAKIMDFGLAKLAGRTQVTQEGRTLGTVSYMSPEQTRGEKVDHRTDIWSFGVMLYEMLTGQLPFRGEFDQAVIYSILNEDPEQITGFHKNIPLELEKILEKCLRKDPEERYPTIFEVRENLACVKRSLDSRGPFSLFRKPAMISKPQRKTVLLLGSIIVVLLILLLLTTGQQVVRDWLGFESIPAEKHLAVLPFTVVGGDSSDRAFCDGLVETLTSKLTQMERFQQSLWVVPTGEIRRSSIVSASEAGKRFGVNLVASGSLQRFNDQVRITMNLIDPKALRQLESVVVTDRITNPSTFQDDLVMHLVQMLNVELQPETRKVLTSGGTTVPDAYDFCLQGLGYLQRYEKLENINTAIGLFKAALREDYSYALAYAGLGEAYWRRYKISKDVQWVKYAISFCDRALKLNNQMPFVYVTLGLIHTGTGRYKKATVDFQKALQLDPVNASAFREMGKMYEAIGNLELAESTYKKAVQFRPSDWATFNNLGVFYYRQGRYKEAVKQFQRVVTFTPDNTRGFNNLGGLYFALERWEEAEQMFKKSLIIAPNYRAYSNLGTLYFYEAHYSAAAQMYEKALGLSNEDYRVWGDLAESYYWNPEERQQAFPIYDRAVALAEQQLEVNPHDVELLADLAGYYARLGKRKKIIIFLKQIKDLEPQNLEVIFVVADTYEQLGERTLALRWIETALKKGFSLSKIDHYPGLKQLRADKRFQRLLKEGNTDVAK